MVVLRDICGAGCWLGWLAGRPKAEATRSGEANVFISGPLHTQKIPIYQPAKLEDYKTTRLQEQKDLQGCKMHLQATRLQDEKHNPRSLVAPGGLADISE